MHNMARSKDESYDVSDSTDWLPTALPSLAPVDSALRCQVCRDFYNTPMITSCSHTFCSLCIRHCLNNDAKCPACRKGDQESKLRNNYAVEELVEAFRSARPQVMGLVEKWQTATSDLPQKRKHEEIGQEDHSSPVRKRTRSGTKAQQSSQMIMIADSDDDDETYDPVTQSSRFECPMCQDAFPTERAVEAHLDHCTGEPSSKKQRVRSTQTSIPPQPVSKSNTKHPERLAALNYSMVKDSALRKKLIEMGVSAAGSRPLMERRHTEWVTLWNSNCDSKKPKGSRELKRDLEIWERTQGGGAPIPNRTNVGGNIRDKDFDGLAWSKNNDDAFKGLVAQAKKKRTVKAEELLKTNRPVESTLPVFTSNSLIEPQAAVAQQSSTGNQPAEPATADGQSLDTSHLPQRPMNDIIPRSPPRTSSQRRFLDEAGPPLEASSSQHPVTQIHDKDIGIDSDIATLRPLQP